METGEGEASSTTSSSTVSASTGRLNTVLVSERTQGGAADSAVVVIKREFNDV